VLTPAFTKKACQQFFSVETEKLAPNMRNKSGVFPSITLERVRVIIRNSNFSKRAASHRPSYFLNKNFKGEIRAWKRS